MNGLDSPIFGSTYKGSHKDFTDPTYSNPRSQGDKEISISNFDDNISDVGSFFYEDVLTDKETLQFVNKHFHLPRTNPNKISLEQFCYLVLQEASKNKRSDLSDIDDFEAFQNEFTEFLRTNLTTQNPNYVSLNALEVNTKGKGLSRYVSTMISELRKEFKTSSKSSVINEEIVRELGAVSKLLEDKKRELVAYEQRLKSFEKELKIREANLKDSLEEEFDRLMRGLENNGSKEKISELQKKFNTHDRTTRDKMRLFEAKLKEMRDSNNAKGKLAAQNSNNEEKYKSKILSLERSNELLKQRSAELGKRLTQEQDENNELNQKITKLKQKVTQLEKSLKESQISKLSSSHPADESHSQSGLISQQHQAEESKEFKAVNTQERPLDLADLRVEGKENPTGPSQVIEKRSPQKSPTKGGTADDTGIRGALRDTNQKNVVQNLSKTRFSQERATHDAVDSKKAVNTTTTTTASKPFGGGYEEVKVLLSALECIIECVKTNKFFRSQLSPRKSRSQHEEDELSKVELGQLLSPKAQILLPAFAELTHLITKPNSSKETHIIMELFHILLNFSFKNSLEHELILPSTKRESTMGSVSKRDRILQDVSVIQNRSLADHDLSVQTEYWKRFSRNSKISPSAIIGQKPSANLRESCLQLFPNVEIQKEIIRIINSYVASSEAVLKNPNTAKVEKESENIESIDEASEGLKFLYVQRLLGYICVLFLTKNKKELIAGIQGLSKDLTVENYAVAEFLKQHFVKSDGVNLLFWLLRESADDQVIMSGLADLLLILGSNGKHYLAFISQISSHTNLKTLLWTMNLNENNMEIFEKLCVIFQRVTYHGSLSGKVSEAYLELFRMKLSEADRSEETEFLASNLRSILTNLQAL